MAKPDINELLAGYEDKKSSGLTQVNGLSGGEALLRDWQDTQRGSDLSWTTKTAVALRSAVEGTVTNGMDQIINHPGHVAVEVLGAAAIGVALRGPVWTKAPALAFAAVGTVAFGKQVVDTTIATGNILDRMNSRNIDQSREQLRAQLGPILFETALMGLAGTGGAKLGEKLPAEFSQLKLSSTLNIARENLGRVLGGGDGFPPGMAPAYAGVGGRPSFQVEAIMPSKANVIEPLGGKRENIMQMSSASNVGGEGIRAKVGTGMNGERIFTVDHVPSGRNVLVTHDGGALTSIGSDGKVMVGFAGGEGRTLELGQTINRVVMTEHAGGLKQFRFNDKLAADLEVTNDGHTIRALLGNGDHLHMLDNVKEGYMEFPHKDGLKTWVEHSGRVVIQLPGGKVHEVQIPDKLAYIRLVEKADGSKEFRFLNDSGAPVAQKVQLPPTPELQAMRAPDEMRNWHDLRNYIAAKNHARENVANNHDYTEGGGGGVYRIEPSHGGYAQYDHSNSHAQHPIFRLPSSQERVMAHEIAGVPYGIMRGNDLSTVADMGLAQQGHGWLVTNYLDRLDFQEQVHHDYF